MKRVSAAIVLCVSGVVLAVTPATWNHFSEADFAKGEQEHTAVSSLGEVLLARRIQVLFSSDDAPGVVSALAVSDGIIYAASGTEGVIYRIEDEEVIRHAETPEAMVTSLTRDKQGLLVGTGGERGGLYRIDAGGMVKRIWSDEKVKYVWAIVPGGEGVLYAATGPEGAVYRISGDGEGEIIYETGKAAKNVLSLIRSPEGLLYAGTDESGLVVEIDPVKKSSRILLDADEKEIAALILDESGGVYAATSDAARVSSAPDAKRNSTKAGRIEKPTTSTKTATQPVGSSVTNPSNPSTPPPSPPSKPKAAVTVVIRPSSSPRPTTRPPSKAPAGPKKGNAVYYIAPDGLIRTVFRKPVTILAMTMHSGQLVLGTGDAGGIYSVTTDGDEVVKLADTDTKQVTALVPLNGENNDLVFATANKGSVGLLSQNFSTEGTFTSPPMDAKQIAKWGTLKLRASVPEKTDLTVSMRSGNVAKPEDTTWGEWSDEQPVGDQFLTVTTPPARFLQYRLKFTSPGESTPLVRSVQIIYQVGNLAPVVSGVKVQVSAKASSGGGPTTGPKVYRNVQIAAADPNKDKLTFKIEMRQVGAQGWIQIAEKLKKPQHSWDTRTVGDGAYKLRVTASDSPSNPVTSALEGVRISEPVVVDNTPPTVGDISGETTDRSGAVRGTTTDATSRIVSLHYSVDSQEDWVAVLPDDGICDSEKEAFSFRIDNLKPGSHRIALKVEDLYGNVGYAQIALSVAE